MKKIRLTFSMEVTDKFESLIQDYDNIKYDILDVDSYPEIEGISGDITVTDDNEVTASYTMTVDDDFVDEAKKWTHHLDWLVNQQKYTDILSLYACEVTEVD